MNRFYRLSVLIICPIIILIVLANFLSLWMFVKGDSMQPSLHTDDIVIIDRISKPYKVGDVIVFSKNNTIFIKRISHTNGKYFTSPDKSYFIYLTEEQYEKTTKVLTPLSNKLFTNMKDKYWVDGDNYKFSENSDLYGPVENSEIIGKVASVIIWQRRK